MGPRVLPVLLVLALATAGWSLSRPDAPAAAGSPLREVQGAAFRLAEDGSGAPVLPREVRDATWRGALDAAGRARVDAAVAAARPEAQALIRGVDGLVTLRLASLPPGTAGLTRPGPDGYEVVLDLDRTWQRLGDRGVVRLVLHELGHVVDSALVPGALDRELDAAIPPGLGCAEGVMGGCAVREERFAESFAKWATNDIGAGLSIGYAVPPPSPSPDAWGRPLARLAAAGA